MVLVSYSDHRCNQTGYSSHRSSRVDSRPLVVVAAAVFVSAVSVCASASRRDDNNDSDSEGRVVDARH